MPVSCGSTRTDCAPNTATASLQPINQKLLFQELEHSIVVANSYVFAHSSTRQRLAATLEDTDTDNLEQEVAQSPPPPTPVYLTGNGLRQTRLPSLTIASRTDVSLAPPQTYELTKLAIELVIKESKEQSKKAIQQIKAMRYSYPEVGHQCPNKTLANTYSVCGSLFVSEGYRPVCVFVCLYLCVLDPLCIEQPAERESETERQRDRDRETETEKGCGTFRLRLMPLAVSYAP